MTYLFVRQEIWLFTSLNQIPTLSSQQKDPSIRKILISSNWSTTVNMYPWSHVLSEGWVSLVPGVVMSGGVCPRGEYLPGHGPGGEYPLLLLTSGGCHHTYGRQVGSMHPTGMYSC